MTYKDLSDILISYLETRSAFQYLFSVYAVFLKVILSAISRQIQQI